MVRVLPEIVPTAEPPPLAETAVLSALSAAPTLVYVEPWTV